MDYNTASMAKRLRACLMCWRLEIQFPGRPNLAHRCKRFDTASTSTQEAVILALCHGVGGMGP